MQSASNIIRSKAVGKIEQTECKTTFSVINFSMLIFTIISAMCFLFLTVATNFNTAIDFQEGITGLSLILALFSGESYEFTSEILGEAVITLPSLLSIFSVAYIAICIVTIISLAISCISNKNMRHNKFLVLFMGLFLIAMYITIIFSKQSTVDIIGTELYLYNVYSPSSMLLILAGVSVLVSVISFYMREKQVMLVKKYWALYLILIVPTALLLVFNIYPIILQIIMSFKTYRFSMGIFGSEWTFSNFITITTDPTMLTVLKNTLILSGARLVFSIIPSILLAIFLFEMTNNKMRKWIQTIVYIPHFMSWIVIYAISYAFLNPEGIINVVMGLLGGSSVDFYNSELLFVPILIIVEVWKEVGWGTILYLAALSSVDPSLYEAAKIDGAGPVQRLRKITLPSITPIIVFLTIMAVGNILKGAGGEQVLLFGKESLEAALVIDTWVLWKGLNGGQYGLATAVSFVQSFIGIILVVFCNKLSKRAVGVGLY